MNDDVLRQLIELDNERRRALAAEPPPAPVAPEGSEQGDFSRNFAKTLPQTKQLFGGTLAYFGDLLGLDNLHDYGMEVYEENSKTVEDLTRPQDEFTNVHSIASAIDFLQGTAGYVAGQALESAAAGLAGSLLGSAVEPGGGTVAGGLAAVVARNQAKSLIKRYVDRQIEKRVAKGMTEDVARTALAKDLGQAAGLATFNVTQELGQIYPDAVAQAKAEGRELTGMDLLRVGASAAGAAAIETLADKIGLKKVLGGTKGSSIARRAAYEMPAGMMREGSTEAAQTVLERLGAGQEVMSPEGRRDLLNSAAMGVVGGGMAGGAASLHENREGGDDLDQALGESEAMRKTLEALPPPTKQPFVVTPQGGAGTPEQHAAAAQERADLGLTPDVERAAAGYPQVELPPESVPRAPLALPAPGQVATPMPDLSVADRADRESLGLTPDVEMAQALSRPRQESERQPLPPPAAGPRLEPFGEGRFIVRGGKDEIKALGLKGVYNAKEGGLVVPANRAPDVQAALNEAAKAPTTAPADLSQEKVRAQQKQEPESLLAAPTPVPAVQPRRQAPAVPPPQTGARMGHETRITAADGTKVAARWGVLDADEVAATMGRAENQPRDRTRAASQAQVGAIARRPDYDLVSDSPTLTDGAPALAADGRVVAGNGRLAGISQAYAQGTAEEYRARLKADAATKGIDPATIDSLKKPVLVRMLPEGTDVGRMAVLSNEGGAMRMSAIEQAKVDADRLGSLDGLASDDAGNVNMPSNHAFVRRMLADMPIEQQAAFVDSRGQLSQEGAMRLRNAVLHKAYGDTETLSRLVESSDPGSRTVLGALVRAAPRMAKLREDIADGKVQDASIADDLVLAVELFNSQKAKGTTVESLVTDGDLVGYPDVTPEALQMARWFEHNLRSAPKMAALLDAYADEIERYGPPGEDMLGGKIVPKKSEVLADAEKRASRETGAAVPGAAKPPGEALRAVGRGEEGGPAVQSGQREQRGEDEGQARREVGLAPADRADNFQLSHQQRTPEQSDEDLRREAAATQGDMLGGTGGAAQEAADRARRARAQNAPVPETGGGLFARVDERAHEAATSPKNDLPEPSREQIEANNATLGHPRIAGFTLSIENPEGSIREDKHHTPPKWRTKMRAHYGYIRDFYFGGKRIAPKARDKEHVDAFVKPGTTKDWDGTAFVIDQIDPASGKYDEAKIMIGYADEADARRGYFENYQQGWDGLGAITPMSVPQLKEWLASGKSTKAVAYNALARAKRKGAERGKEISGGVRRLAPDEKSLSESEGQALPGLRRPGDQGVRGVAGELPAVLGGARSEAGQADVAGQDRHERQLRAGELPLGDSATADGKSQVLPQDQDQRRTADDTGGSASSRAATDDLAASGEPQGGAGKIAARGTAAVPEGQQVSGARRSDEERAGMGAPARSAGTNATRAPAPEDAARPRANAGPAPTSNEVSAPTVAEIHAKADELGIPWDDDAAFMARTKELTGKEHLDDLTGPERQKVFDDLKAEKRSTSPVAESQAPAPDAGEAGAAPGQAGAAPPTAGPADLFSSVAGALRTAAEAIEKAGKPAEPGAPIEDFGEKIGGARKDTATSTGPRRAKAEGQDDTPAWRKRFVAIQNIKTGKWTVMDTRTDRMMRDGWRTLEFDTQEQADAMVPLAAVALKHRAILASDGKYEIWRQVTDRKRVKVVDQQFDSREDAMKYVAEHAAEIMDVKTSFGEEILAKPEKAVRTGAERRTGNATPKMFSDTFGFRGVEFGLWNNQSERQEVMNHAYDGLLDMAEILGIPPKAISLNGDLALAFGARGQGLSGAKAHYEIDYGAINLTKMSGAGSLAHEWFHALDHYLARQEGKAATERKPNESGDLVYEQKGNTRDMMSHGRLASGSKLRPELWQAYERLLNAMFRKAATYVDDTAKAEEFVGRARRDLQDELATIRNALTKTLEYKSRHNKPATTEQLAQFDVLAERIANGGELGTQYRYNKMGNHPANRRAAMAGRYSNDALDGISAILKQVRGITGFSTDQKGWLNKVGAYMQHLDQRIKMLESAQKGDEKTKNVPTSYAMEAKKIDQGRASDYWTTPHEMAARAFSAYIEDKAAAQGHITQFLAYGSDNKFYRLLNLRPFPEGAEREAINAEFDKFFQTVRAVETDRGVALQSRAPNVGRTDTSAEGVWALPSRLKDGATHVAVVVTEAGRRFAYGDSAAQARGRAELLRRQGDRKDGRGGEATAGLAAHAARKLVSARALDAHYAKVLERNGGLTAKKDALGHCFELSAKLARDGLGSMLVGLRQKDGESFWHAVVRLPNGVIFDTTLEQSFEPGVYQDLGFETRETLTPEEVRNFLADHDNAFPAPHNLGLAPITEGREYQSRQNVQQRHGSVHFSALQGIVGRLTKHLPGAPKILVYQNHEQLPENLRDGLGDKTEGMYRDGIVYLFSDAIQSEARAAWVVVHELHHAGLLGAYGEQLDAALSDAERNAFIKRLADAITTDRQGQISRLDAVNEAMAELGAAIDTGDFDAIGERYGVVVPSAFRGGLRGAIGRFIEALRAILNRLLGREEFSHEDVQDMLATVRGALAGEGPVGETAAAMQSQAAAGQPLFSRAPGPANAREPDARQRVRDGLEDLFSTAKGFNLWHRTVGTQFHKAKVNPHFARVFRAGQAFLDDVSRFALGASDLAPDLLPKIDSIKAAFKGFAKAADVAAVSKAVFAGTLTDEKVYTPEELRAKFKLSDEQVRLYQQARAAIDKSLDTLGVAEMARLARGLGVGDKVTQAVDSGDPEQAAQLLAGALSERAQAKRDAAEQARAAGDDDKADRLDGEAEPFAKAAADIRQKAERVSELKQKGYAPLMRFGQYTVYVTRDGEDGEQEKLYFGMFEHEREANAMARQLRRQFPDADVENGVMSQDAYRLFRGVSPETVALLAEESGMRPGDAMQEYLRLAINSRSAMKRLIRREGVAGFATDLDRVLATFVTSNARAASGYLHFAEMNDAVNEVPQSHGDVKDEAIRLSEYLQDPREEAQGLRGFLFINYLGGSIAAALVNMTQPVTMSFPYLARWGARKAGAALVRAATVGRDALAPDERAALERAVKDGIVAPQELHQMYAESMRRFGSNRAFRRFTTAWGSFFSLAEQFNRKTTFIAAYQVAKDMGAAALAKHGYESAFDFAEDAVRETQGLYNRGNRPNWARGAIGATVFTFKQFSIAYLEFLKRLPTRERALALGILVMAAGLQGLPGADDLDDILDTIGESLGYDFNSKAAKRKFVQKTIGAAFGPEVADFLLEGVSAIPGVPLDVQQRLGVSNLIPGTGAFKKSTIDRGADALEIIGPLGGMVRDAMQAFSLVQRGRFGDALSMAYPLALRNLERGADIAHTGQYRDSEGRKVTDASPADAFVKGIGFQPRHVAVESRRMAEQAQRVRLVRVTEDEIADLWAQGIVDKDPGKVAEAREQLREWNARNPQTPVRVNFGQIRRRVQEMRKSRVERMLERTPKDIRSSVREGIGGS